MGVDSTEIFIPFTFIISFQRQYRRRFKRGSVRCEKRLCESSKKGEEEEEKTSCRHHLKVWTRGVCCNDFTTDFQSSMNTFTNKLSACEAARNTYYKTQ